MSCEGMNYDIPVGCVVCALKTERRGGERRAHKEKPNVLNVIFKKYMVISEAKLNNFN